MGDEPTLTSIDKKMAVLCERMGNSITLQKGYAKKMDEHIKAENKRMNNMERCAEGVASKVEDNKEEIDRLRNRSNVTDFILAIGTVIAGVLGINTKG